MINKVVSIQSIGRFVDYKALRSTDFEKLTLIYGNNGTGKTTLCAIFRSLCTGDSCHIIERKTLGSSIDPSVQLRVNSQNINYKNGQWNMVQSNVEIFDSKFINDNIFSGSRIEHEHRKNLYNFVIGSEGIQKSILVDELDTTIKEITSKISSNANLLKAHTKNSIDLHKFIKLENDVEIDLKINTKSNEIDELKKINLIQEKPALELLNLKDLPIMKLKKLLAQSIDSISQEAIERTKSHIELCHMDGESWIREGLSYVQDDSCPFCGERLDNNAYITDYHNCFNNTYRELLRELNEFLKELEQFFSVDYIHNIQNTITRNNNNAQFWENFIQLKNPEISFSQIKTIWDALSSLFRNSVKQKISSPLESMTIDENFNTVINDYLDIQSKINSYNELIKIFNQKITIKKQSLASKNMQNIIKEIEILNFIKLRYSDEVNNLCNDYINLVNQKEQLTQQKSKAKDDLNNYTEDIMAKCQSGINDYLQKFGAKFEIVSIGTSFSGGKPSSTYYININDVDVGLDGSGKTDDTASFKNTLSEGDKNALAFAFFLAKLDLDINLDSKIIIFDDPMTSLDGFRKNCTEQQIVSLINKSNQIIVSSHDSVFLKSISDKVSGQFPTNTLQIIGYADHSELDYWDIEKSTQSEFQLTYMMLLNYLKGETNSDNLSIARAIRPVLEGNLRMRFPDKFSSNNWLGDMIDKIRASDAADPLTVMKPIVKEIIEINNYSKQFHHQNPAIPSVQINDIELKNYVKRTINLTRGVIITGTN